MYDYAVWYNGIVIADIKSDTDKSALCQARHIYGPDVTIEKY